MRGIFRLIATCVFLFLPISAGIGINAGRLWQLLTLVLVLMAIIFLPTAKVTHRKYWAFATAASFFGVLISTVRTINVAEHLQAGILLFGFIALAPTACKNLVTAYPSMRQALTIAFMSGQTFSAIIAIAQSSGLGIFQLDSASGRSDGLAGHPNLLGLMSGIAICILAYSKLQKTRRTNSHLSTILILINVGSLLLSGSISALIASTLGIWILIHAMRIRTSTILLYTTGLVAISAAYLSLSKSFTSIPNPFNRVQQVTGNTGDIGTWDVRTQVYGFAMNEIVKNPLIGVGIDDESGVFQHPLDGAVLVHNILLRGWLQGGILLFAALVAIYAAATLAIAASRKFHYSEVSCATLATTLAFALTSAAFYQPYFWILVAMAWATIEPGFPFRRPALTDRTQRRNTIQIANQAIYSHTLGPPR